MNTKREREREREPPCKYAILVGRLFGRGPLSLRKERTRRKRKVIVTRRRYTRVHFRVGRGGWNFENRPSHPGVIAYIRGLNCLWSQTQCVPGPRVRA